MIALVVVGAWALLAAAPGWAASMFAPAPLAPVSPGADFLVSGDFNNDHQPDVAFSNSGNSVSVMLGDGHGRFSPAPGSPFATGQGPAAVASGDFNGDGNTDLAVNNYSDGTVSVLLGDGHGGFTQAPGSPISVGAKPRSLAVGYFFAGAPADLAVATSGGVVLLAGDGHGGFSPMSSSPITSVSTPVAVVVGDFNSDGNADLAVLDAINNTVSMFLGDGNGNFTQAPGSPASTGVPAEQCSSSFCFYGGESLAQGDFNADGHRDLAAGFANGEVSVLLGDGHGGLALAPGSPFAADNANPSLPSSGLQIITLSGADFNGDGKDDLLAADYFQGGCGQMACNLPTNAVSVLLSNGDGQFTQAPGSPYEVSGVVASAATGDFNGDGHLDVVATDDSSCHGDALVALLNQGASGPDAPAGVYPGDGCPKAPPNPGTGGGGSPTDSGDGVPTPAPGCQQPHVDVPGVGVLYASCFSFDKSSGTFSATGHVRFNGLDLEPLDPSVPNQLKVSIQPASKQLTIEGDAQLKLGSIVVWKLLHHEKLTYQLKVPGEAKARLVLNNIQQRVQARLKGFPLRGDISLDFSPDNGGMISAGIHVALQKPIPDVTGDAKLSLSNADGLRVDSLEFKVPEAKLGPISISDLDVKYDRLTDAWEGKLTASFPAKPRDITVSAGGKFVHGQFDSAYASVKGLGIALGNPAVFLNDLDLAVSREPKFEGGVGVTAGPELTLSSNKLRLLALHGGFLYERPGGHSHFQLSGKLVLLTDWAHVQGQIDYWPDTQTVQLGGGFNFPDSGFPFPTFGFSASGGLSGAFKPGGFNIEGNAAIKWDQHVDIGPVHKTVSFEQGAKGLISDRGIAVCHVGWPEVGLGFTWSSHDFKAFGDSCDISPWRSLAFPSSAGAAAAGHVFVVRRGLPFEAFNMLGRDGVPPSVRVSGPHGESARTSADFSPVSGPKFLIMQIPSQSRTFIEVRDPGPGNWTVTPLAGSAPITGYQQGDPLPAPVVRATVTGRGVHRQLSWRLRAIRGQRVTFVEQGRHLSRAIVTSAAPRGQRSFVPAPGPGGKRTIVAQVEQNGLPRRDLVVGSYRATAPARPSRVARFRLVRAGRTLVVRWDRSRNASGYELRLAMGDGRRVLADLPARARSYRLTDLDPATSATATIQALSEVAGNGPMTRSRLSTPRRVLATRVPGTARRGRALVFQARALRAGTLNSELIDARGDIVASARTRLARNTSRQVRITTRGVARGRYTLLLAFSLDGSAKPYTSTVRETLR